MSVSAPAPVIQSGKYEVVPDPLECGDRTEHDFGFDSIEWTWDAEFTGDGDVDPSSGTGDSASFTIQFGDAPGSWSVSVTFTATGTNATFSCTDQAQGAVSFGSAVANMTVTPFLGVQITEDLLKGVQVNTNVPDTGTAAISGIPGTITATAWTLNGPAGCAFAPPPPPVAPSVTFKEAGSASPAFQNETVMVNVTFEVSDPDGTQTEFCSKSTNFSVVALDVGMPLVLCGRNKEDSVEAFTLDFKTQNLPDDHKIDLYGTASGHWFEDAGKTIPAKSSYSKPKLPMTLYHNLYVAPPGQPSGSSPSVPLGTHTLKASHSHSRAEYEVTYEIIQVEIIAELPRSGPEVPFEYKQDPMALLIPVPDLEPGDDPAKHPERAKLTFRKHRLPPKGKLILNYDSGAMTLYDSSGAAVAAGTSVNIATPTGPLAPLVSGDLILYAVGKAPKFETVISINYAGDQGACTLDEHSATVFELNWYIDAKNQHGAEIPPQDPDVDTETEPGKFIPVNRTDEDGDAIPDYADIEVPGQKALIPALLVIEPEELEWERLNVRVTYAGDDTPPDLGALHPLPILHKGRPSGFTNYLVTIQNSNPLRLWALDDPGEERTTEKYVIPDEIQTIREIKPDFAGEATLWLEGLPGTTGPRDFNDLLKFEVTAISDIEEDHMLTEKKVRAHLFEAKLGLNTSNDPNDPDLKLRPGIPDVEFKINDYDEMVKDQGDGFQWWWEREEQGIGLGMITHSSIVDLFPMTVFIPQELLDNGFKAYMSREGNLQDLLIYPVVHQPISDRLGHLKDSTVGENQRSAFGMGKLVTASHSPINVPRGGEPPLEYLVKAKGSGVEQATLFLWLRDSGGHFIPVDSWRATFKDPQEFWAFYSARNKAAGRLGYRVEDGRVVSSDFYHIDPQPIGGIRDPNKSKYLVMLHGFNNSVDDALTRFNEIWKRVFWLGFRGQFVGVTWHGDVGPLPFLNFDGSTRNAFQTSTALMLFLHKDVRNWAGGVQNVDVMAHSLGNLVVWDAMRLYQRTGQGANNPLFRNLISVEAAVWPETFDPEGPVVYGAEQSPEFNITYTVDALKEHSWSFWFNQTAHPASASLGGQLHHSYVPDDDILFIGMRLNDNKNRGTGLLPTGMGGIPPYHFSRSVLQGTPPEAPEWRAPEGIKQPHAAWGPGRWSRTVQNRLPDKVPTLMLKGHRKPNYYLFDLNLPVGVTAHPLPAKNENVTDPDFGWRSGKHSDFAVGEAGDANAKMWFPIIWDWYEQFVQPAISINEE